MTFSSLHLVPERPSAEVSFLFICLLIQHLNLLWGGIDRQTDPNREMIEMQKDLLLSIMVVVPCTVPQWCDFLHIPIYTETAAAGLVEELLLHSYLWVIPGNREMER